MSGGERDKRGKQGKIQADPRGRTARTGRVPAALPHHQGTDAGEAGAGGRRGKPPGGVPGEATQVSLQDGGQGGGRETREGTRIQPRHGEGQRGAHGAEEQQ